jgi:single-stranded-DNA-specific exonuclease
MVATHGRIWQFAHCETEAIRRLASELKISPLLARVLVGRQITSREAGLKFFSRKLTELHDPELLPGVSQAAERVVAAIKEGRLITIYGDYDVDGVTSTSLLWHCIKLAGGRAEYYIPSRLEEGYGLNVGAIETLAAQDASQLVVSVDCGITSVAEARRAKELGLELIITDHHQFAATLPEETILVHPRLPGGYPFGDLCGAGVAFKLAWAICTRLGDGKKASPRMKEFLLSAIGLAAIGTVADVVPLVGENRVLVHYGLSTINEKSSVGLKALLKAAGLADKSAIAADDIGFGIGPRINAAGRLGQARLAVELLTTDNEPRAQQLAAYLDELNKSRQTLERKMLKQAKELVTEHPTWGDERALVLTHDEWHAGILGIVAGRVAEHFQRPTILLGPSASVEVLQGSGRSFAGFNLHSGLMACGESLMTFGGHHAAVGMKVARLRVDEFREALVEYVAQNHAVEPGAAPLLIDAEVMLSEINARAIEELDLLAPFGNTNPRPMFAATNVELAAPPKTMGEGGRHLSLLLRQQQTTIRAVAFGQGEWAEEIATHPRIKLAFQPVINEFRGQRNVDLHVKDWAPV